MLKTIILSPTGTVFEGEAESVFLPGDTGEFEVLPLHKPIVGLLRAGHIVIDWHRAIPVRRGVVRMRGDRLVALVEQ